MQKPPPAHSHFDKLFGGLAWEEEDGNQVWGDSRGFCRPNTPPPRAGQWVPTLREAQLKQVPVIPVPVTAPAGLDLALLITTLLKVQSDAQLAQTNANHSNLIAFQTATAQAWAAKGGDKESKLTAAKRQILQAFAGSTPAGKFNVEQVYQDIDAKGGSSDALGRILRK